MDRTPDFAEAEGGVEANAVGVVEFGVAGEFAIAAGAGPIFYEVEKGATDALVAGVFGNEPALEVRDGGDG